MEYPTADELMLELELLENEMPEPDKSPLSQAVQSSSLDALSHMLDTEHIDEEDLVTAIAQAIDDNNFDALVILVSSTKGSLCFLCKAGNSRTPLMHAASKGRDAMVQLLLARGSHINAQDTMGRTAVFHAVQNSHEATALLILDHKTLTISEGVDNSGNPVLTIAIMKDMVDVVDKLIRFGADLEQTDDCGMTPLHNAARWRSYAAVELLVKAGADVNAQTEATDWGSSEREGFSALMWAASTITDGCNSCPGCVRSARAGSGHEILYFLLKHGADPSLESLSGERMLDILLVQDRCAVTPALLQTLSDDALVGTASAADCDALRVVLSLDRVTVNSTDSKGWTMLLHAATRNSPEVCQMLLGFGALPAGNLDGWSPMILAAKYGQAENVKLFLPGNPEERKLAIRFAMRHRQIDALNVLLFQGGAHTVHAGTTSDPLTPKALAREPCELAIEESLADTKRVESTSRVCVCCMNLESSVVFLPCKHLCVCPDCACKVSHCPLCRVPITEKMVVYSS